MVGKPGKLAKNPKFLPVMVVFQSEGFYICAVLALFLLRVNYSKESYNNS